MLTRIALLLCFLFCTSLKADFTPPVVSGESQDPVVKMNELIKASEESLKRLKALQELLLQYKAAEKTAIDNPNNTANLNQLVQLAKELHEAIQENYLEDYFPAQFMGEISKLSQVANKKNIPPPK